MFQTRVLSDIRRQKIKELLNRIGCDPKGVEIMAPKAEHFLVYARGLDPRGANILKQEFLSSDGEVAVSWGALDISTKDTEVLMMGTMDQFKRVEGKLEEQPFDLPRLAEEINRTLRSYREKRELPWGGEPCQVMGILNVTPDSFYDGGRYSREEDAVKRALEMEKNGADMIDIGGESTRPGSERVSVEEELERVLPVIEEVAPEVDVPISIDTHKPRVAEEAVKAGADIINDVFGLRKEGMPEKVAALDVPVIIMHMQGRPKDMQEDPEYDDVVTDICSFFYERIELAKKAGVKKDNIIIDPGIGFGKNLEHNLEILARLDEFSSLGCPVLLGASRKSFLGEILDKRSENRLYGSLAAASLAVEKRVSILRVHDVAETVDAVETISSICAQR